LLHHAFLLPSTPDAPHHQGGTRQRAGVRGKDRRRRKGSREQEQTKGG